MLLLKRTVYMYIIIFISITIRNFGSIVNCRFYLLMLLFTGHTVTNTSKGTEQDSSDSSDNESKDPYRLKDELAAVGKFCQGFK